jgi:EAL domain-containing protein (putative c-di-GMP-specific phosphodiesterase class I)
VLLEQRVQSVYEPIVCTHSLTVYGYEALARGPEGSEYGPATALFDAAEEHDMLYELDALCRAAALDGASGFPAGTKLFMNIRPSAINDPRFHPSALIRTLEKSHLKPSDVVFEISEQESIDNYSVFREARDKYGQLGFQFALDDTGAGYASLEAAMELAPEFIKVDRSFMKGIDEDAGRQAMVRGFQQVARSVGARIIGEGLDRLEELQKLAELGIEFGQGWLFGRATPMRAKAR